MINIFSKIISNLNNDFNMDLSSQNDGDYKSFSEEFEATKNELSQTKENSSQNNLKLLKDKEKINALYIAGNFSILNQHDFKIDFSKTSKNSSGCKSYKINIKTLKDSDVDFLKKLTQKNEIHTNSIQNNQQQSCITVSDDTGIAYKSTDFSKGLNDLIDYAYTTKRPVRIDFDKNTSVILKIDKAGKVSADFIPGDKAVELALKNALPELQAKFDNENLPYNELTSRNYNDQQERRNKQKENDKNE
ncbi:MAG: hypothetical protein WC197_07615 [Candidatus Gastranaerophilaceae bacterium]|jgi:hypothetical protein